MKCRRQEAFMCQDVEFKDRFGQFRDFLLIFLMIFVCNTNIHIYIIFVKFGYLFRLWHKLARLEGPSSIAIMG